MPKTSECPKGNLATTVVASALVNTVVFMGQIFLGDSISRAQDMPPMTRIAASADSAKPTSIPPKREAWMDASDYSVAHPNVATFAVNGRAQNATNQQIINYIEERFAKNGISNSIAFTRREDSIGVSMYFFLNGHQYGPVGFANMNATIDQVAGHAKALQAQ